MALMFLLIAAIVLVLVALPRHPQVQRAPVVIRTREQIRRNRR